MVTRLLLSLRKANASQEAWSLGELTTLTTMGFGEGRSGISTRDEIRMDTLTSAYEEVQSQP